MAKVTIADIAREAQVSVTTVSRFINGNYGKMSQATRNRVQDTITRLDYRPSASARRMRQQSTHVVGVIVSDISNVFSSLLFSGIYTELQPAGYDVMLMNSNNSVREEHDEIERLLAQEADGLIIQPNSTDFRSYEDVTSARVPLVMVDRRPPNQPDSVTSIVSNNREACHDLVGRLADMGYDNLVVVRRLRSDLSAQTPRVEGLKQAAEERHVLMVTIGAEGQDAAWLQREIDTTLRHLNGRTALVSLMGPTLFDILTALRNLGITFPDDIGLVSFDDWRWSQHVRDGVYLLEQDPRILGQESAKNLLEQIRAKESGSGGNDPYTASRQLVLPVSIVKAPSI
ncbi:transcriptional regulator [Bifidobacterium primatium]|uniref:Transcriptional regulator n=2 Tax=Bifidobacterium TaxID=1678 RepID=A0A2M9HAD3_9BIFI|nr:MULTISPECIES: LacI family DNA-binding transcriptional regulator [Bifidobacterium]NEG96538.1 LacI family DNA-binding transcriptional regulator [Bifidobacterium sp. SMB2]NEH10545.1 LacI family DNA-binding transcriptional regulator [Bifidobacterium saimiriisciurei]NEH10672.1 LacI family DNA-binding transcriptional regulator [Bifidobacterium saimiriisciurei]PJM73774.1 transcriptional regulator [Bifidobacterium primatium]